MASPYLKRPARSLEQAKRDRAKRRRQYARASDDQEAPSARERDDETCRETGEPVSPGQD